jgi:hypothetical protein
VGTRGGGPDRDHPAGSGTRPSTCREAAKSLAPDVERAVAQVMTFIAENEYAQVNPAFAEVVMWLASHIHDEARHVEVFTKRALVGGFRGYALASTELSLEDSLGPDGLSRLRRCC